MRHGRLVAGLFLSFFTAQSAFVVLAPTLPDVARDFGISIGAAGQLRTVASVAGVLGALLLMPLARRTTVRQLLLGGLAALGLGALASAAAPSFVLLALGQVVIGAGLAAVLSAGLAAAVEWPEPEARSRVLAWTIVGQPAAWVAGMPVVGALSDIGWRWGWILVPASALVAIAALPREPAREGPKLRPRDTGRAWRDRRVRRWALGELMAYAAWGGTLVYAGALLGDSYDLRAGTVGLLLGGAAIAYFPGTFAARRRLEGDKRRLLASLALALAAGVAAFGLVRPSVGVSTALFALLVLLAGARTIVGSAFGLDAAPGHKVGIGSLRSAATQLGYLLGAAAGGLAVNLGGYEALGVTLAAFFAAGAVPYLSGGPRRRSVRAAERMLAPIYDHWSVRDWTAIPLRCRLVVVGRGMSRAHVWTLRDGRLWRLESFADGAAALRAGARPCRRNA
jgi:DHA1 family inner membrane transport protein